jgi:MSHA biogenesis protein MshP
MSGKNERGFSLILAIFLMVVFALLLVALVRIETASNLISGAQMTAERALMAAQSGAEAGVYQIAPANGSPASSCFSAISSSSLAGLADCSVSATCDSATDTSGNTDFLVTSTGTCGDATRTVVVSLTESNQGQQSQNCSVCVSNSFFRILFSCSTGWECLPCISGFSQFCGVCYQNSCVDGICPACAGSTASSVSLNYWLERLQ